MEYLNTAIQVLEKNGFKITTPRKLVLQALQDTDQAVSPYDLQKTIGKQVDLNHVTIYRILEVLQDLHLVHKVANGGFIKCSIPDIKGCHHFLICNSCGLTKEFVEEEHSHPHLPAELEKQFVITNHTYELSGTCKTCLTH